MAMDSDTFLTTVLCNPVNQIIADELSRLALPDAWADDAIAAVEERALWARYGL